MSSRNRTDCINYGHLLRGNMNTCGRSQIGHIGLRSHVHAFYGYLRGNLASIIDGVASCIVVVYLEG